VKTAATSMGYTVLAPERPRGEEFLEQIRALMPDISVVVAYGHILRREVLDVPPMGSINLHASLLPELRGAAPITWAIVRGHEFTGVSVMRMVEAMDAGPVLHQIREPILPGETASELTVRLSELGAEALVEGLALLAGGLANEVPQDPELATYAPKVDRATARIDWTRTAPELERHVRGMDAVPGAWSELDGESVKLFCPRVVDGPGAGGVAGVVLVADPKSGLVIATGSGALAIDEVQPPGRRRMPATDWIRGRGVETGRRFV
jgi:methionyl-tRNA formyltransferase